MKQELITQPIKDLARAIAHAEGFGIKGAVPTRAHNPGDLKIPNWTGPVTGQEGISVFESDEVGWNHLYLQLERIASGRSHVYKLNMTFEQFAAKWTDTAQSSWLDNVIYKLRDLYHDVDENTTLEKFFSRNS